jgi:hypothetical protein
MKEHDGESPRPRVIAILIWLVATVGAVVLLLIQASHDPVPSIVRFELAWHGGDALRIRRSRSRQAAPVGDERSQPPRRCPQFGPRTGRRDLRRSMSVS